MTPGTSHDGHIWLLEHYEPGAPSSLLRGRLESMTEAAGATGVRVIVAAILPAEEEALCLVEADTPNAIRAVCRRSDFRVDRLTRVEPVTTPTTEDS